MDTKLQQAISTIKAGDKMAGQCLLAQIIKADPGNESAWLWMSATLDDPQKKKQCLQRVLQINPANETARESLVRLESSTAESPRLEDMVPQSPVRTKSKPQKNAKPVPRSAAYALGRAIGAASKTEKTAETTTQEATKKKARKRSGLEKVLLVLLGLFLCGTLLNSLNPRTQQTVTTDYGTFTYPGGTGYVDGRDLDAEPPLTIMNVNVWSTTDTSRRRLCKIPHGTKVDILNVKLDDGWYYFQVQSGSCKGWLSWWFVNAASYEPVGDRMYD